jgi:F-type H+-transporting ATPase subunit alpha
MDLAQYRELAAFSQFGSDLDKATLAQLNRGERMMEILKQPQYKPLPVAKQVISIYCGAKGYLDSVPVKLVQQFLEGLLDFMDDKHPQVEIELNHNGDLNEKVEKLLGQVIGIFRDSFLETHVNNKVHDDEEKDS